MELENHLSQRWSSTQCNNEEFKVNTLDDHKSHSNLTTHNILTLIPSKSAIDPRISFPVNFSA